MKMKKTRRRLSRAQGTFCLILLLASGFMLAEIGRDVVTYFNLQAEMRSSERMLEETTAQKEQLEQTKKNLTNPDYLEKVARGKYHYSKNGEQIFVFPKVDK